MGYQLAMGVGVTGYVYTSLCTPKCVPLPLLYTFQFRWA